MDSSAWGGIRATSTMVSFSIPSFLYKALLAQRDMSCVPLRIRRPRDETLLHRVRFQGAIPVRIEKSLKPESAGGAQTKLLYDVEGRGSVPRRGGAPWGMERGDWACRRNGGALNCAPGAGRGSGAGAGGRGD